MIIPDSRLINILPNSQEKAGDLQASSPEFPLAVVQGMASGLPVICSDSGALPYQLGVDGIIVKERNPSDLAKMMIKTMEEKTWAKEIGLKMLERVLNSFEINHPNKCFYQTIKAHLDGKPENAIEDQVNAYL